jgi:homopolymeric O-antigen transport system permease protein
MPDPQKIIVLESGKKESHYWTELWSYRELIYFLVWRDILVRYKQTVFGVAWALVRPLSAVIVFTFLFDKLADLPSNGVPYPLLVFVGMIPWQFFSSALTASSDSLVANSTLVSKVYFPRMIVPGSAIIGNALDMLISGVLLAGMFFWFSVLPDWRILMLPLFFILMFAATFGAGLWFSALNVKYHDFRYVVPFMMQLGVYVSPVGFLSEVVPDGWRFFYAINPMVSVIDGFRWALFAGAVDLDARGLLLSIVVTSIVLVTGIRHFRNTERTFADVI